MVKQNKNINNHTRKESEKSNLEHFGVLFPLPDSELSWRWHPYCLFQWWLACCHQRCQLLLIIEVDLLNINKLLASKRADHILCVLNWKNWRNYVLVLPCFDHVHGMNFLVKWAADSHPERRSFQTDYVLGCYADYRNVFWKWILPPTLSKNYQSQYV